MKDGGGYIVVAPVHAGLNFENLVNFHRCNTEVIIPDHLPKKGKELFSGRSLAWNEALHCEDLFASFPLALIRI
jgi:hypothetical protein